MAVIVNRVKIVRPKDPTLVSACCNNLFPLALYVIVLAVYLLFASMAGFFATGHNYFSHFAYALLHGSIAFITQPQSTLDLIHFDNNLFLFAPPSPALLILPFVWLFGINISDVLYTAILGALNPVFVFLVVLQFAEVLKIRVSKIIALLLAVFYAFGTTHFYEAVTGTVWHTGQIVTQTYLLLSLFSLFQYCLTHKWLHLAGLSAFFSLAILGRNQLLLATPGLLLLCYVIDKKYWKQIALTIAASTAISIMLNGWYNISRFGSVFENGFRYHENHPYFEHFIQAYGLFSFIFIPINLWYHFINPLRININWPFVFQPDYMGNSIFFVSPLFLLLFMYFFNRQLYKKNKWLVISLVFASACAYIPALLQHSTGWRQFGARYLLDVTPFLLLLLVPIIGSVPRKLLLVLIFLSIYINLHAFVLFMVI